jgi:rhodanese-related sulfurtransferase
MTKEGRGMIATKISAHEVKARMDRGDPMVFIDARNPKAWETSNAKLTGAIRVPVDEVDRHLRDIPHDRSIITYCT